MQGVLVAKREIPHACLFSIFGKYANSFGSSMNVACTQRVWFGKREENMFKRGRVIKRGVFYGDLL